MGTPERDGRSQITTRYPRTKRNLSYVAGFATCPPQMQTCPDAAPIRAETSAQTGPARRRLRIGDRVEDAPALTLTEGHAALHQAIVGDRLWWALDATLAHSWPGRARSARLPPRRGGAALLRRPSARCVLFLTEVRDSRSAGHRRGQRRRGRRAVGARGLSRTGDRHPARVLPAADRDGFPGRRAPGDTRGCRQADRRPAVSILNGAQGIGEIMNQIIGQAGPTLELAKRALATNGNSTRRAPEVEDEAPAGSTSSGS